MREVNRPFVMKGRVVLQKKKEDGVKFINRSKVTMVLDYSLKANLINLDIEQNKISLRK